MEEAEGMDELLKQKERPLTVDDLAAKVGKSKAYVYGRLKLLALCAEARKAFYEGRISASVALLLARIPTPELQEEALETVGGDEFEDPMAYRTAQDFILDKYTLRLKDAPFDPADAQLVAGAGSCSACPKRSGAQPELFADVGKDRGDVCTDTACFALKKKAAWKALQEEAKEKGATLLTEAQSKKVFGYDGKIAEWGDYVSLADKCPDDPKGRTWKQLIGDQEVEKSLAMSPRGTVVPVLDKRAAAEAVKAAGHKFASEATRSRAAQDPSADRERRKQELKRLRVRKAIALIVERAEKKPLDEAFIAGAILDMAWHDTAVDICKRREIETGKGRRPDDALEALRKKMTPAQLRGLLVEILVSRGAYFTYSVGDGDALKAAAKLYGVDLGKCEAEAKAEIQARVDAKKAKAKGRGAAPAKGKKATSKPAAHELPRGTAEELGAEDCLDCGVPANQPSPTGCEECDHGRTPPAKKAGPASLVWTEVEDTHRADGIGGEYSILPGAGAAFTWKPSWVPRSGPSHLLGSVAKLTDAKAACERHHVERAGDALLANAGDGKLNAKGLKGAAVKRGGASRG